ncbi:MAG TPA: hypothetical protein VEH54_05730 [Steroidobacteraceae bacterium]|nr:hypothetical protein [Steroidobacteraceae bacterium]
MMLIASVSAAATNVPFTNEHASQHPPASVAEWARGARLFADLGNYHRTVTTSSPLAQQYFDQGMRLLWAFNHDEATRSFAKATELDPGCAACYWGVALTVGPNYNVLKIEAVRAQLAWDALQEAKQRAANASAVEQALITALATRYPAPDPPAPSDIERILNAYASAMLEVAGRFPDDLDVQTLCAEAQMTVHAWKLWTADGQPVAGTLDIEARLESVLRRAPDHPGANHYYIHVMEASPHPEKALASAERLKGLMPAAGHLEHMPAHIFQRVGRYEAAAEANRRGVVADHAYFAATEAPDFYVMYLGHNYDFLAYAAAMEGRKAETLNAVQEGVGVMPLPMLLAMGSTGWTLSAQYAALVRFGLWDELIALGPPDTRARGLTAGYLYGRGVALAARGRLAEAQSTLEELKRFADAENAAADKDDTLVGVLAVAVPIVAARIAASSNEGLQAITLLEQAVAAEDRLPYNEPAEWFFPARHLLGAQLLIEGQAAQAERVYREDLRRNPENGWALYGLEAALRAEGRAREAARVAQSFEVAWKHADIELPASAFWFAGPDTASCECEHHPPAAPPRRAEPIREPPSARVD